MTPANTAKVLDALNLSRIMAQDKDGNYTREITPAWITEAIAIMREEVEQNKPKLPKDDVAHHPV